MENNNQNDQLKRDLGAFLVIAVISIGSAVLVNIATQWFVNGGVL